VVGHDRPGRDEIIAARSGVVRNLAAERTDLDSTFGIIDGAPRGKQPAATTENVAGEWGHTAPPTHDGDAGGVHVHNLHPRGAGFGVVAVQAARGASRLNDIRAQKTTIDIGASQAVVINYDSTKTRTGAEGSTRH